MSVREYVGARYVPIIVGEWDNTRTYEPLMVVTHQGNSYTSRQYVPAGIEITNDSYWVLSANYNAQVEAYRNEVRDILPYDETPTDGSIKGVTSDGIKKAIASETTRATQAEQALGARIDTTDTNIAHLDAQMDATTDSNLLNKITEEKQRATTKENELQSSLTTISNNSPFVRFDDELQSSIPSNDAYHSDSFIQTARRSFGRYENAVSAAFITNSTSDNPRPKVLGNTLEFIAATYPNRDSCGLYVENTLIPESILIEASKVTYTQKSAIVDSSISLTKILPGMLIDACNAYAVNSKWWFAEVLSVDGNVINVSNWYQQRDDGTTTISTPSNVNLHVNANTKAWGANINVYTPENASTGLEVGVWNDSSTSYKDVVGFDAKMLHGHGDSAYVAGGNFSTALLAKTDTAVDASNCTDYALITKTSKIRADGACVNPRLPVQVVSADTNLSLNFAIHIINGGSNFTISDSETGCFVIIFNHTDNPITVASRKIPANTTKILVWIDTTWIAM